MMRWSDGATVLGGALLAVVCLGHSRPAVAANDVEPKTGPATARYRVVDCNSAEAQARALPAVQALAGQEASDLPVSDMEQVGDACRRYGTGPFAYCAGSCKYTHLSCEEYATSTGLKCGCIIPIMQ